MSALLLFLLVFAASYLWGSIPTGKIITNLVSQQDIQKIGSGNIGATNVYRALGLRLAALVFGLDALKGLLPVLFALQHSYILGLVAACAVITGNIFSIYLNFRGGKGAATAAGALVLLFPVLILVCLGLAATIILVTKMVSVATLSSVLTFILTTLWLGPTSSRLAALYISGLIIWAHRSNIQRLLAGQEAKITSKNKSL
jgi:glycerol-3-phosphate acyltransferase PlsY